MKILSLLLSLCASTAFAALQVANVFTSNMVLQRNQPITFWGKDAPGASIQATFAGITRETTASHLGKWSVTFPSMEADHQQQTLSVTNGAETKTLDNILIGDVWICGGQSNMEMPVGAKFKRGWTALNCEEECKACNYPELRMVRQAFKISLIDKLEDASPLWGGWMTATPQTCPNFSATAYFFGRDLMQTFNVPIGLILTPVGGSPIQGWISEDGYRNAGLTQELQQLNQFRTNQAGLDAYDQAEKDRYARQAREWTAQFENLPVVKKSAKAAANWFAPELDESDWTVGNQPANQVSVCWYRTTFTIPENLKGKPLHFTSNELGARSFAWCNGKPVYTDTAFARHIDCTIPVEQLNADGVNQITVRSDFYGVPFMWHPNLQTSSFQIGADNQNVTLTTLKRRNQLGVGCRDLPIPPFPSLPNQNYKSIWCAGNMYNAMIHPWTQLPVKGVIWYQGCCNANDPRYYHLNRALIQDWRAQWHQPDLPFLIVQLAGYAGSENWKNEDPNLVQYQTYARTRDIQQKMMDIPNVGVATAVDIGENTNIHPANKQEVGRRLALEAKRIVYGMDIVSRGPVFREARPEGNAIRVYFDNAEGLRTSDGQMPNAFTVAGEDKVFVYADSVVIDGETVLVSAKNVPAPKYVRYGYFNYRGDLNLQNGAGLPAYPVMSDAMDYSALPL